MANDILRSNDKMFQIFFRLRESKKKTDTTWKCGSLSFTFAHPPEDEKKTKTKTKTKTKQNKKNTLLTLFPHGTR